MPFRTPVDIANRGLQLLGQERLSETLGFTEDSKRASAMSFAYDKLRRTELRRNFWKFSTRHAVLRPVSPATLLVAPAMWSSTTTYRVGAIVSDEGNTLWVSNYPTNLNNNPGNSYFWEVYTGPLTADVWDSTLSYYSGELVYTFTGDGTYKVFVSLQNSNSDNPATPTAYDAATTYMRDQVVTASAVAYISLTDLNKGNTPSATPAAWAVGTTYASAAQAYASDGFIYTSTGAGNIGHDPMTDGGVHWTNTNVLKPWTNVFTGGTGSAKWLDLSPIALTDFFMSYPVGAGPSTQASTKNIYRLPAAFLRVCPQDPKGGAVPYLGGPGAPGYDDWTLEGDFIISHSVSPIILRAVFDIQDVTKMDDMFCEGLACRMAHATCEEITQSTGKKADAASSYVKFMSEARLTNAIETGPIESPEDELLAVRR